MTPDKPISEQTYPFAEIESKWQKYWEERGTYKFNWNSPKEKFYCLTMFSYPSGDKLHMGHWYCYAPTDSFARFKRLQGYEVFEPMGFDAFGLPAENYAIKTGVHPAISTRQNVEFMRNQLKRIGAMYDWDYEVNTSEPEYYKWTQWWFLLMYKRGLAYQKEALVNWCPNDQTVLANEQVTSDNKCERCGAEITRKSLRQWFFKITEYNQRLLDGLDTIDWPEKTKAMQRYWIGKSEGSEIKFQIQNSKSQSEESNSIKVFTTRADTLFGVTYIVLAPEHPLAKQIATPEQKKAVEDYIAQAATVSEVDRASTERAKTGVPTGAYAIHPFTNEQVPIWIADYVIGSYGTGAVMAVPAHDERDFAFAKRYDLPIKEVIRRDEGGGMRDEKNTNSAFTDYGIMINSGEFDGLESKAGITAVGKKLEEQGRGKPTITWHLRDWTISRQRYWGAPIPMIHCAKCGSVPVDEKDLPVRLPDEIEEYKPKGKPPLATVPEFLNTICPKCGGPAERDTDTMDTFVDSSWYYLRYPDARLDTAPFDSNHMKPLLPIAQYVGGPEHAMGHLIYSRFFGKVAKDAGLIECEEPFSRLVHQGIILNNGERMSKSKGNVVAPEPILEHYGSDVLRCYLMFSGDYTQGGDWSDKGITGVERFIARVWRLGMAVSQGTTPLNPPVNGGSEIPRDVERKLHQTIKALTTDLQQFQFNTALARLMELTNQIYNWVGSDLKNVQKSPAVIQVLETVSIILAPLAPHLSEELWMLLGHKETIFNQTWPAFDDEKAKDDQVTIAVQINGKLRETFEIQRDSANDLVTETALQLEKVKAAVEGKKIVKTIVVPNKIVNLVIQ